MKKSTLTALLATLVLGLGSARAAEDAPAFTLTDSNGKAHSLSDFAGKVVVLEWINHDCPFVKKHYDKGNMQALQKEATDKGAVWLSICSSAEGKQGYQTAEGHNKLAKEKGSNATAILIDADGKVGKAYKAETTPHLYVISAEGKLVYQGAIDDKRSTDAADIATSKNYVREALAAVWEGKPVAEAKTKAYGCGVKY
jgi:peroxiredoxin